MKTNDITKLMSPTLILNQSQADSEFNLKKKAALGVHGVINMSEE